MKNWTNFVDDYRLYLKIERGLSQNSVDNYIFDVTRLLTYISINDIHVSPLNISADIIQQFIYSIADELTPRSRARIISGLKSFFNYLIFEDYRTDSPMELIEAPKTGRKLPDTLSVQEIDLLVNAIDMDSNEGYRNRAMLEILYSCGLRVSELTDLKLSGLFFKEGYIKVTGKGSKQRFIPVPASAQNHINAYIIHTRSAVSIKKGYEDTLFLNRRGAGLTRAMVFTIIKNLAQKTGLQKTISPHTFRHSFATHLLENGAGLRAIQLMLGHESITTTEIYMHLDRKFLNTVLNTYHPRR